MKVLVTGATWSAGLAVIRGLAKAGWEVLGADTRKLRLGAHSRYATSHWLLPATEAAFVPALASLLEREKPDVLLPVGQTAWIVKHQDRFKPLAALLAPDYAGFRIADDHRAGGEACREANIPAPRTLLPAEAAGLLRGGATVVVKPCANAGGAQGVSFVTEAGRLRWVLKETRARFGKVFLQEFIPGEAPVKTVNLLFSQEAELLAYFTTDKLRQWPGTGGLSVLSVSTDDWSLVEQVLPFFQKYQWRGPAEVELKIDARDGRAKVIEINPRFWGYIGFPVQCGVNFPLLACEAALRPRQRPGVWPVYEVGVKYLQPGLYLKAVREELRQSTNRGGCLRQALAELRGRKVANNADWRDGLVILAKMCTRFKPKQ